MTDRTSLGDRMKEYERVWQSSLTRRAPLVIRVDGRAFHTYLRHAAKPFDMDFVAQMARVAVKLCKELSGAVLAYHQSDEISVLLCDYRDVDTQPWFGGRLQKIVSVAAGIATAELCWERRDRPVFDARAFVIPDPVEVANYFVWRQRDAIRNSVAMAAQAVFNQSQLHGVNREGMKTMLERHGTPWDDFPPEARHGQIVAHGRDDDGRGHWEAFPAPLFTATPDNWLADVIPAMAAFGKPEPPF